MSKLRRHLGEQLPDGLLGIEDGDMTKYQNVLVIGHKKQVLELHGLTADAAVAPVRQMIEFGDSPGTSISSDDESEEWEEIEEKDCGSLIVNPRPAAFRRYSKKWVREQGSRRWTQEDYTDILRSLRAL